MAIYFGSTDSKISGALGRAVKAGKMRRIASRIYTDDLKSPVEDLVRRHRWEILAHFYPGAVVSHRSAFEANVSPQGKLHISRPGGPRPKKILPGMEICIWQGPGAQPEDAQTGFGLNEALFASGQARAILENMQIERARGDDEAKILSREQIESWLDQQIRVFSIEWLETLLAQTEKLAVRLGWQREQRVFAGLVAAFRNQASSQRLVTEVARARAIGKPYDPERVTLFGLVQARLATEQFIELPAATSAEFENRAFWEAYFSNYIEGTKFTVEEAQAIVFNPSVAKDLTRKRPEDAHDVLETFRLIADPKISKEIAKTPDDFIALVKRRHARMMASRIDVEPGVFKNKDNSFGSRVFVRWQLVDETLKRGFLLVNTLPTAEARALYMLFLLSEVHPFNDGNGRISRLGMNAELEAAGHARLILPTSFRTDYIGVLELLTSHGDPGAFVRFGHKLIEMNKQMPFASFDASYAYFRKTGALEEIPSTFNFSDLPK